MPWTAPSYILLKRESVLRNWNCSSTLWNLKFLGTHLEFRADNGEGEPAWLWGYKWSPWFCLLWRALVMLLHAGEQQSECMEGKTSSNILSTCIALSRVQNTSHYLVPILTVALWDRSSIISPVVQMGNWGAANRAVCRRLPLSMITWRHLNWGLSGFQLSF